jgi:hypothetical protein
VVKIGHGEGRGLNFFYLEREGISSISTGFLIHHGKLSAVKRVQFVSDRMSYVILRGRWCILRTLPDRCLYVVRKIPHCTVFSKPQ